MTDLIFINPDMKITIDGKVFKVKGTFNFIDNVQTHFNLPFNRIAEKMDKDDLLLSDYANIIRHGIEVGGSEDLPTADAIKQYIVDEIGLSNARFFIGWFFQACIMPVEARGKFLEAKREAMGAVLDSLQNEATKKLEKPKKSGTQQKSPSENTAVSA